jgi:hypothetical protein
MKSFLFLILMTIGSQTVRSQNQNNFDFKTPPVLIAGVRYQFSIPLNEELVIYKLVGNGMTATGTNDNLFLTPKHPQIDSTYTISLIKILNQDTTVIRNQIFDVIQMPTPDLLLGEHGGNSLIQIHQDSTLQISHIELIDNLSTTNKVGWYGLFGVVEIEGFEQKFRFNGDQLSEEILKQFSLLTKPTQVTINLTFNGSDQTKRATQSVFTIQCMSEAEWQGFKNPFHKLYLNKNVEIIQESSFYHQDTIVINNSDELYIHCLSDRNGNNLRYEFRSLRSSDNFSVHKIIGEKEKLVNMKNKKGSYLIKLFFNESFYDELVLTIN